MKTFSRKGKAVKIFITAESKEEAAQILHSPLGEIAGRLSGVWFERTARREAAQ